MIFDVALWRLWRLGESAPSLPVVAWVDAPNAWSAIERVMGWYGLRYAGHAAAAAQDGSLVYRAYGVRCDWENRAGERRCADALL